MRSGKNTETSFEIDRAFFPFDTSSLPDDAVIQSTLLKVFVSSKGVKDDDGDDFLTVVQGLQPSESTLTTADFDLAGAVDAPTEGIQPSDRRDLSAISVNQYLLFPLSAAGHSWISKTGPTKLALREGHDVRDSAFTPVTRTTATYPQYNTIQLKTSEAPGTSTDPILEVTYTLPPVPGTLQDLSYIYDANGNIMSITDASDTQSANVSTYSYDDLNCLTSAVVTGRRQRFPNPLPACILHIQTLFPFFLYAKSLPHSSP